MCNGGEGAHRGCAECGPAGPQHHAAGGAVPLGRKLLLPKDPEEQYEQQPPLPVQVPSSLPALCR